MDMAIKLESSDVCYKIYSKSYETSAFSPKGYQISYLQSECLFNLAVKTKNNYFCNDIQTLSTSTLDGSKISKENCKIEAQKGSSTDISNSFNHTLVMTTMGYTEDMWPDYIKKEFLNSGTDEGIVREQSWISFYLETVYKNKNDFMNRMTRLPTFTN